MVLVLQKKNKRNYILLFIQQKQKEPGERKGLKIFNEIFASKNGAEAFLLIQFRQAFFTVGIMAGFTGDNSQDRDNPVTDPGKNDPEHKQ